MLKQYLNRLTFSFITPQKYFVAFGIVSILLIFLRLFNYSLSDHRYDANFEDYFTSNYKVFKIRIPKNINFANEKVPVAEPKVHDAIERELIKNTYWQSQSLVLHKRASRWFPIIEPILEKNNIPDDFKYIALVESQLTNVVSPRGATGFWQIIESTAIGYGLEISAEVDERYHIIKSTEAACKYFKESYKQFGNWTLVAASYNLGMGGIQSQLNKQHVDRYYDLHLTAETGVYVYRILAMKEIISRPKVYGFKLRKKDIQHPIPTKTITIDSSITDLSEFANAQGINYGILKYFNPWLRANTLTINGYQQGLMPKEEKLKRKKYAIEIPINKVTMKDLGLTEDVMETITICDSIPGTVLCPIPMDTLIPEKSIPKMY